MGRRGFRLGKFFGIPVHVDGSWLIIFVWVTWSLAGQYYPQLYADWSVSVRWLIAILTSLLFFSSVLAHELGHSLVARAQGTPVRGITLFIFGGVAEITSEPSSAKKEFLMALIGPGISLVLAGVFAVFYLLVRGISEPMGALSLFLAGINLSVGVFNLVPGFPLDGGRVLRSILWGIRKDLNWATRWASRVGQGIAYLLILIGILRAFAGDFVGGLWMAFIGFFLENAARSSYAQLTVRNLLEGQVVGDIMSEECQLLPPQLTLDVFVDQYVLAGGDRCYAVGGPQGFMGLLTIHNLREVPRDKWPSTRVSDAVTPPDQLRVVAPDTPLWDALQQMTMQGVNQLPVLKEGELVGMIRRDTLLTFLRNRSELGV